MPTGAAAARGDIWLADLNRQRLTFAVKTSGVITSVRPHFQRLRFSRFFYLLFSGPFQLPAKRPSRILFTP
jgi:hypothetical protein